MTKRSLLPLLLVLGSAGLSGCKFDEGLIIYNMEGTVVIPEAAATRTFACDCVDADADGTCDTAGSCPETTPPDTVGATWSVTDIRNIGPVYIGLFPAVEAADVIAAYPHPEVGPVFQEGLQGDTYPYGGTTVGDLRFGCFDALTCKMTSGRWESYQHIVDWFNDTLSLPVIDADGRTVENGEYFRQTCFDLMEVTSDEEVMLLPAGMNEEDVTPADLDFVQNADGDFEGKFKLWQQDFFWDRDAEAKTGCEPGIDCPAFSVWAFMDGPGRGDASFVTCDNDDFVGFEVEEYNHDFFGGRSNPTVLNQPDAFISAGDWVSDQFLDGNQFVDGHYEWQNRYDQPTIRLGHEVTQ